MSKDKVLKIEVVEGRDLVAMDSDGTSDPFVVCVVGNKQKKTKTIKNTLNPKWRIGSQSEVMSFKKVGPKVKEILVKCYDWDFMSTADRMGQFKVPMSLLEDGKEVEDWFELEPQKPGDPVSGKLRLRLHLVNSAASSGGAEAKPKAPFLEVIKNKDLIRLEELLKSGADVNEADKRKETALHWAASMNDFSEDGITVLNKLLQHPKTNVNFRNMDGNSPFHVFCKRCTAPDCSKTFDLFLQRGADVNVQNDLGETPIHQAVFNQTMNLFMIDMLLKNKANPNLGTKSGETPIHYAVRLGAPKLVTLLLRNGADISSKDNAPSTLDVAKEGGFTKISEILKETKDMLDWLEKVGMTKYKNVFLQNEFYLYLLPDVTREQWQKLIPDSKDRKQLYELIHELQEQDPEKKLKEKRDNAEKRRQIRKQESYLRRQLVQSARKAVDLTKSGNYTVVEAEKWEIDQSELVFAESLGSGASGEVFKGYYKEEEVAIKVLKSQNTAKEIEEFKKEFEILWAIRSPHIVHLFGAGIQKNKLIMVMEFCNRGSLYDVLRDETVVFDWDRYFQFSMEMVSAIKDLHSHKVLHRDLKTLNLLVTEDWQVKVCDFGLSRFDTSSNLATLNKCRGTYMYIAPEVYNCEKFTSRSDVYSIGIILWEMANRIVKGKYEKPYEEYKNLEFDFQILIQACMMNLRPTIPAETPEPLAELIRHTFLPDKDSRPDTPELYDQLLKLREDYNANKEEWDKTVGRPLKTSSN